MNQSVEDAIAAHENAAKALVSAVKSEYPKGTLLSVYLGGHNLTLEVVSHGESWWRNPGEIIGRNVSTGKVRRFYPCNIASSAYNETANGRAENGGTDHATGT